MDADKTPEPISIGQHAELLVEATGYAVISTDPNGVIVGWNGAAERLFGWSRAEACGRSADMIFTPEDRAADAPAREMATALANGVAADVRWHVMRDGTRFWAVGELTALHCASGHVGFAKIMRDRTDELHTERRLASSEQRLRLVIEAARLATWEYDTVTQTMEVNPELLGLLAWPEDRPFDLDLLRTWYLPGERARMQAAARGAFARGERFFEVEFGMLCGDQVSRWFNLRAEVRLGADGRPAKVLGVLLDVSERHAVREALRIGEERLRIAQAAGGIGAFELLETTGALTISEEFCRIWGIPARPEIPFSEMIGSVHPDDREKVVSGRANLQPGATDYVEYRILRSDTGEERWIARRGEMMPGASAGQHRFVGVIMDITDRKQAEDTLRRSELRWRGLFERMQEGFFLGEMVDTGGGPRDFRFIEINPAFESLTGLRADDALGSTVREVAPGFPEDLIEAYGHVAETGEPLHLESFIPALGNRWYEARVRKVFPGRFTVLFMEITARKATEAALKASEAQFRTMAQAMPNHVWTASADGHVNWFNDRAYEYSGKRPGELDGDGWTSLLHPKDLRGAVKAWGQAVKSGQLFEAQFRLRRADGVYRWHLARAAPLLDDAGEQVRWAGTHTDIEDEKAAAEALARLNATLEARVEERTAALNEAHEALRQSQKMEAVGQLTGGIAHDFNNLLTGISGSLELLQRRLRQGRTEDLEPYIAAATTSASRAAALTHRLLAFSRRQPLDPRPVDANRLMASMEELLRRTLGERIELNMVLSEDLWPPLCDSNQLENAMLNLAINARDAMPEGGRLTIETANAHLDSAYAAQAREVSPGRYVCISVTDTGSGMTAEVMERAFDPFFTTKPMGQGTGLGLSMIYGFARQSEGYVKIYSEVGVGTAVKLYLPRHAEGGEADIEDAARAEPRLHRVLGGETVLVVEDEPAVRDLVVEVLTDLGYRVLQAQDGVAGLEVAQAAPHIDLLVTDVGLPGMNGRQLADTLRAARPALKVLFMTGYAENAALANGVLGPGMQMITKPFPIETLMSRIETMLDSDA